MAPIHRIEMYHEHPPPPIPIKLKPKNLKKLSHAKGPVYVLLPNPAALNYRPNFPMIPAHQLHQQHPQQHPQQYPQQHLQQQQRPQQQPQQQRIRPRGHQQPVVRKERNSSNWIKHLTSEEEDPRIDLPRSEVHLSSRVASMTIADVSPRFALKKILMLTENRQYRESASFINRLSSNTFGVIVDDLPVDALVEAMPQSLPIIESLYAKVFLTSTSLQFLRPDNVVLQMVRNFATQQDSGGRDPSANVWRMDYCGPFISSCKKLLRVIVLSEPKIRKNLVQRRKALDKTIEGLGQHGLVGTSDENLMNLHKALQVEFHRVVNSYKIALSKLEELDLAHQKKKQVGRTVSNGPAPVAASHQRLLSLKQSEIQERLIKNKTLLNVVEPTLTNHSLDVFLEILQRRIELDKDVLFQYTQLRKETTAVGAPVASKSTPDLPSDVVVAPLLMKFSHGCQQVLELMREVSSDEVVAEEDDEDSSDVSGYHSDSDSTVMASGNSPFVPKSARYNFLSRSVRLGNGGSIRTSLLINSLGLESGGVKGQPAIQKRRTPLTAARASRFTEESDSSASSSESSRPCQRCHQHETAAAAAAAETASKAAEESSNGLNLSMQLQATLLKGELNRANATISALQEREKQMTARLASQEVEITELGSVKADSGKCWTPPPTPPTPPVATPSTPSISNEQRASLIRSFGNLYAQSRLETQEWLDHLEQLRHADQLKSKLLFSVIVLAFRSLQATSSQMRDHIRRILQIPPNLSPSSNKTQLPPPPPPPPLPPPPSMTPSSAARRPLPPPPPPKNSNIRRKEEKTCAGAEVEQAISSYLRQSVDSFDLTKNTEDVCSQIWATLYDYPCLQSCEGLVKYIKDSVRLAWSLVNQSPAFHLEYESRKFNAEHHIRFHTSNPNEDVIKTYLWPALVEGHNGPYLHKAVVIT